MIWELTSTTSPLLTLHERTESGCQTRLSDETKFEFGLEREN